MTEKLNTTIWAGIVVAILVEFVMVGFEFWLNTHGLGRPFSSAQMLRDAAHAAGVPENQPLVIGAGVRVLLGIAGFATGAIWMWMKTGQEESAKD